MNLVDIPRVDFVCTPKVTMNKSSTKNKLARNKMANTASSSRTQLIMTQKDQDQQQQQQQEPREPIMSPISDTQVDTSKDSSFLNYEDLILSQNYNPNSDVAWQVASPEVLRKIHKAIIKNQRFRNIKRRTFANDENEAQQAAVEPTIKSPARVKPKKRNKVKKRFNANIENIIKTIEMKIKSDEFLANSSVQRNSTNSNSSPLCLEACHSHSSTNSNSSPLCLEACHSHSLECDSIPDKDCGILGGIIKQTTSDNTEESDTHSLPSGCKNVDESFTWSEDESLEENVFIHNCMDSLTERSLGLNTIQNGEAKLQRPKIQNNIKYSNQSSSKKNSKFSDKRKTFSSCKNQTVTCSESRFSSSDDMNLSDSEIDEMLSQLPEKDLLEPQNTKKAQSEIPLVSPGALDVEQFSNNRITRLMVKKANEQLLGNQQQTNEKPLRKSENNGTNECEMQLTKPYFLRNSVTRKTGSGANSRASVSVSCARQCVYSVKSSDDLFEDTATTDSSDDLFEDSEITDELLVDVYDDIFKDHM